MDIKLFNARIITLNPSAEVIENGVVEIHNGSITRVSAPRDGELMEGAEDMHGCWVMPGFVNCHTHIPMTMFRGIADDLKLDDWLYKHIFPLEARYVTPDNVRISTRLGLIEMIQSGTTCANDMYYFEEEVAKEADKTGFRIRLNDSVMSYSAPCYNTPSEAERLNERLIHKYADNPLIAPTVCVHSIYTHDAKGILSAKRLADQYMVPLHIHLSETKKEVEESLVKNGKTPVKFLFDLGVLDTNTIAAHCVHFSPEDIDIFAKSGAGVAHCPKCNAKLASGIADTETYVKAGIPVGIGTDGVASNNLHDMVEETRMATLLPKLLHRDPTARTAFEAVRMATLGGAEVLKLADQIGSIEPGKQADMIVIDSSAINLNPSFDVYSSIIYNLHSQNILHSIIGGRWVMRNRKVLGVDVDDTITEMNRLTKRILWEK